MAATEPAMISARGFTERYNEARKTLEERGIPGTMWRTCVKCQMLLNARRTLRRSSYCDDPECRRQDNIAHRAFKASQNCRLCGRKARVRKVHESST